MLQYFHEHETGRNRNKTKIMGVKQIGVQAQTLECIYEYRFSFAWACSIMHQKFQITMRVSFLFTVCCHSRCEQIIFLPSPRNNNNNSAQCSFFTLFFMSITIFFLNSVVVLSSRLRAFFCLLPYILRRFPLCGLLCYHSQCMQAREVR